MNANEHTPADPHDTVERGLATDAAEAFLKGGALTVGGLVAKDGYGWAKGKLAPSEPPSSQVILPPGVNQPGDE